MLKKYFPLSLMTLLLLIFLAGCEKEEFVPSDDYSLLLDEIEMLTSEAYTADLAEFDDQEEFDPNMIEFKGKRPCFVFIFPISFATNNSDVPVVINNRIELREFLHKWKQNQTDAVSKPKLIFPVKVKFFDGTIVKVESEEQMIEIRKKCSQNKPDLPKFRLCFDPVFPIYVAIPTQNAPVEVNSKQELHDLLKKWKENYPDSADRPTIVFPIKIKTFNGEIVEVESMEMLKKYMRDCIRKLRKKHQGK
jgi:hypothetical protein